MSTIPEPWRSAMLQAGMTDPRYRDPRPSFGRLAEAANLHTTTISRMAYGTHASKPSAIEAVAHALRVDPVEVSQWAHRARSVTEPYQVPDEVHQLGERERRALTELIRAMAAAKESGPRGNPAPSTRAGVSPANVTREESVEVDPAPGAPGRPRGQGHRPKRQSG